MLASALLGAALGGSPADASVSFERTDVPLPGAPDSVALGDLDGRNGEDIAIALPAQGTVGVMLNNGDGTFAAMQQYSGGGNCAGTAVDITLGDVTQPAPGNRLLPDGKLDAYLACTPYVARLTGDGNGALGNPDAFNLGVAQYLGTDTLDLLALTHRPDGNPVPLLVFQRQGAPSGRRLCMSYELDPGQLVCNSTPVQGPLAVGDLNGSAPGVPPDEIVTSEGGDQMGIFGWVDNPPLTWSDGVRTVPGGVESSALGDLNNDGDLDVLAGENVNSLSDRVESIHYLDWGSTGLDQVATPLPSIPGLDAVAVADVDGDGRNDVVGAGDYGRGIVHLGLGGGNFDGGHDVAQLGYQNPATSTRVTLAVGDLTCDGRPDLVVTDALAHAVMVYRNGAASSAGTCAAPPPGGETTATPGPAGAAAPPPPPAVPRTCEKPGTAAFTLGTPGKDVLVGTGGRDVLSGRGGDDCLFGLANDDRLTGGTGDDLLRGASGGDRLGGDAGNDKIDGGSGNDTITPGAGKDTVTASGGNDTISARDQITDTIDCGAGQDKVTADRADKVKHCEYVKRPVRKRR